MESIFQYANDHLGKSAIAQKRNYDKGIKQRLFSKGTFVWRWYPPKANTNIGLGWDGPYLVVDKLSDLVFRIQKSQTGPVISVHVDHLKPYEGISAPTSWLDGDINQSNDQSMISETNNDSVNVDNGATSSPSDTVAQSPEVRTRLGRLVKPRIRYSP